jgi:hypothetical protein
MISDIGRIFYFGVEGGRAGVRHVWALRSGWMRREWRQDGADTCAQEHAST